MTAPQPPAPDHNKMKRVLIPAVALAALVIVLAVVVGNMSGGNRKMSDGSNGSADDPDLKEISSGVKYRDLKEGSGDACPPDAKVKVNYKGWLADGTVFDSNRDGKPIEFGLNKVIAGWQEGIPGMKPGGIRKLVIAPEKAYGSQPRDGIPAGSTLIFEVELVSINVIIDITKLSDGTKPAEPDPLLKEIVPGVKYRDIKAGGGEPCPKGSPRISIHYTGWLPNGVMFDSSRKSGQPASFELSGLIKGWQEGIPGMKPGGIRKLVISPEMGYGDRKVGDIPPNSTLIFEVEYFGANKY